MYLPVATCFQLMVVPLPCACFTDDELFSGENGVDLLIEDQLLRHKDLPTSATRKPTATSQGTTRTTDPSTRAMPSSPAQPSASPSPASFPSPALPASAQQLSATFHTSSVVLPDPLQETGLQPSTQEPATTVAHAATAPPVAPALPALAPEDAPEEATFTATAPPTTVRTDLPGKARGTVPDSPTLSPEEEDDIRNVIGELIWPG